MDGRLKVRLLTETAKLPTRAYPTDAGLDLYADQLVTLKAYERSLVSTGIAIELPTNTVGRILPKSGLAVQGISVDAGVIDSNYRGEVKVIVVNHFCFSYPITPGMKIAQLLIQPILLLEPLAVAELTPADRGEKGFGSSGI